MIPLKGFVRLMMLKSLMRCFSLDVLLTIFALLLFVEHNGGVLDLKSRIIRFLDRLGAISLFAQDVVGLEELRAFLKLEN